MPKPTKTALTTAQNSTLLSRIFLSIGVALFFFSIGIYTAKYFDTRKLPVKTETARDNMFFIEHISNGSMAPIEGKKDIFELSVRNETDFINYAANAPLDVLGRISINEYLGIWETYFSNNLPLATLVIHNEDGSETVTIGQLQSAVKQQNKNRINYTFRLLGTEELANLTLAEKPYQDKTDKFDEATLYVHTETVNASGISLLHNTPLVD